MNLDRDFAPPPTHSLSPQQLEAITQQSRILFLEEEAPENLAILKQGIADLITKQKNVNSTEYTTLIRAAHTLKGGAGIAQLHELSQLAHQLEDLLEQLFQQPENQSTLELIAENFQQIYELTSQATVNLNLHHLTEIDEEEIIQSLIFSASETSKYFSENQRLVCLAKNELSQFIADFIQATPSRQSFIKTAISVDLENCLQRLEALLASTGNRLTHDRLTNPQNYLPYSQNYHLKNVETDFSIFGSLNFAKSIPSLPFYKNIKEALSNFADEITLFSENLNLICLQKYSKFIKQEIENNSEYLEELVDQICLEIRHWKSDIIQIINQQNTVPVGKDKEQFIENSNSKHNQHIFKDKAAQIEKKSDKKNEDISVNEEQNTADTTTPLTIPKQFLKYVVVKNLGTPNSLTLRVPVEQLDRLSDRVGELFINYEQIYEYQQQLYQTSRNLKKQIQHLKSLNNYPQKNNVIANSVWQREHQNLIAAPNFNLLNSNEALIAPIFNQNSQEFYEIALQIYESSSDIDLLSHELQETLDKLHNSLQNLNEDLTQSRLVTFGLLADRFQASLNTLNQQYHKTVELVVEGKNLLIDQALLQQLHTPLTHLFRNAFDHGIETTSKRLEAGKPKIAKIFLSAQISANYLTISLADDGRGIDTATIYQRAKETGLIDTHTPREQLTDQEILEFIFAPGFSTATTKSDLSGRGVGLDIVRYQIARMRGTVQVETYLGAGTKFTINVPFKHRVIKVLLCRTSSRTLAIPCLNILGIIDLSDKDFIGRSDNRRGSVNSELKVVWNNQSIRVFYLIDLLPYRHDVSTETASTDTAVGLILEINNEPIVVAVDAILQERELVIKPFDETVPVPAYLAGCTVLGTGEIVPVISPDELREKINVTKEKTDKALASAYPGSNNEPAQLTEEWNHSASPGTIVAEIHAEIGEDRGIFKESFPLSYSPSPAAFFPPKPAVLIADDSIAVRRALDQLLSEAGYQVTQCNDGKAALEEIQRSAETFDLVISDLEMPGMNGFELLANLRSHPNTKNLPVAILSSRDSEQCRQRAISLGVTAYFTKPWEPASLLDQIAALLS